MLKTLPLILTSCFIGLCSGNTAPATAPDFRLAKEASKTAVVPSADDGEQITKQAQITDIKAGDYLASRYAQSKHDWSSANQFITPIVGLSSREEIRQRAMVIAMGAGEIGRAIELAKKIREANSSDPNTIADTFLIVDAFKAKEFEKADQLFKALGDDATMRFIGPFMQGWISAALGKSDIKGLRNNTCLLYTSPSPRDQRGSRMPSSA